MIFRGATCKGREWSNRLGRRNGVAVETERTKKAVIADESGEGEDG